MPSAQLPLLAVAAACCLSLARAADELSAAPVDAPVSVEYCTEDADCRWAGDAGAACSPSKVCTCSTHSGDLCQVGPSGTVTRATTPVDFVVELLEVACERAQVDALVADTKQRVAAAQAANPSVLGVCGSVTLIVQVESPTADLAASVANVTAALRESVVARSAFTKVFSTDDVVVKVHASQTASGLAVCDPHAVSTVVAYDGRCVALECEVGYSVSRRTVAGKDLLVCAVPATAVPRSVGDDDLSGGAIASIVIGCISIAALLVGVLVWAVCLRKADASEGHGNRNEPYEAKENDIHV